MYVGGAWEEGLSKQHFGHCAPHTPYIDGLVIGLAAVDDLGGAVVASSHIACPFYLLFSGLGRGYLADGGGYAEVS